MIIHGKWKIIDCERNGDIRDGKSELTNLTKGLVKITDSYWDGCDCGEAYLIFEFDSKYYNRVNEMIGKYYKCSFDENIENIPIIEDFNSINQILDFRKKNYSHTIKNIGEGEVLMNLYINTIADRKQIEQAIRKAIEVTGNDYKAISFNLKTYKPNYSDKFHVDVVFYFVVKFSNLDNEKLKRFGVDKYNNKTDATWLKKNNYFGEIALCYNGCSYRGITNDFLKAYYG